MVDLLQDADMLDTLSAERNMQLYLLAETSWIYHHGYRLAIWWHLSMQALAVKTDVAKKYLIELLEKFIEWNKRTEVFAWHVLHYGEEWITKYIRIAENFLASLLADQAALA